MYLWLNNFTASMFKAVFSSTKGMLELRQERLCRCGGLIQAGT